jgi:molybdate transport system substrate-binding protein
VNLGSARAAAFAVALALAVCSCAGPVASATPEAFVDPKAPQVELTIYAAASLNGVLDAAKAEYAKVDSTVTLVISTDSSAALATKIEQGAPTDVFLSADTTNPANLIARGFAKDPARTFASNQLTVIVPTDNPGGLVSPLDLIKPGVKVIAAGPSVPITKYAGQVIDNIAKVDGYADFASRYAANVVSEEENVAAVVTKIVLGQGDAAIVYVTDAATSTGVKSIDVLADWNVRARYAGVVVKASRNAQAAEAFIDWLTSADGQSVLISFGFLPPPLD